MSNNLTKESDYIISDTNGITYRAKTLPLHPQILSCNYPMRDKNQQTHLFCVGKPETHTCFLF